MTLKYYFDLMSQPSRSMYIFLKLSKIPFEACPVALRKGEHLSEEFKEKYSRFQKVPFIHDDNFKLSESVAILRYLTKKYNVPDNWYPKDIQEQAKVDEYMEWQHNNVRAYCSLYFIKKWVEPMLSGEEPSPDRSTFYKENLEKCLDGFEQLWLGQGQPFIAGNKISFADLLAANEIEQPRMAGYDARKGRPILSAWIERVRNECQPFYDEANALVNKVAAKTEGNVKAKL